MAWTEERTRILTRLWADGWTGSEIGERLGLTRGAVISKLHRLGLARGGKNQTAAAQALPSSRHQPAPKLSAAPDTVSSSPGAPEWEIHAGPQPAIVCEPDPSGMKFVAPPDERSRYERRADLIREVERQVHHDLTRLRQLGWSICGIARYTGLEPGTVTVLLNEPQAFPELDRRRRKKKARPGQPAPGSRHSAGKPLKPEIAMKGDMAEIS